MLRPVHVSLLGSSHPYRKSRVPTLMPTLQESVTDEPCWNSSLWLCGSLAKVWRSCKTKALTGRTVTLKVKYADFQQITRSRTIDRGLFDAEELAAISMTLLEGLYPFDKGVRLLGVTLSSLEPKDAESIGQQLSLGLPDTQGPNKGRR